MCDIFIVTLSHHIVTSVYRTINHTCPEVEFVWKCFVSIYCKKHFIFFILNLNFYKTEPFADHFMSFCPFNILIGRYYIHLQQFLVSVRVPHAIHALEWTFGFDTACISSQLPCDWQSNQNNHKLHPKQVGGAANSQPQLWHPTAL